MNSVELINEVRELINKGRLGFALEKLLVGLKGNEGPASSWRDTVRGFQSQFKALERAKRRATVSYENVQLTTNQVTNALLDVLSAIERGEEAPIENQITSGPASKIPWMPIGIVVALVLAAASFFMLRQQNNESGDTSGTDKPDDGVITEQQVCPDFEDESIFNIMILPYKSLGGEQKKIDDALKIRLATMMEQYNIEGSVRGKKIDATSSDYPVTASDAIPFAEPCMAQLIIWGFTEEIDEGTTTITKFRFLEKDHFALTGLDLNQVDTISSMSSIATSQELTENIEQSIKLIFGLIALETENYVASAELLEETVDERGGAGEVPNWGLILAESKIKNGEHDGAMAIYDQILEKDDQNVEALTRKGILAFNSGDYELAMTSLNPVLEKDPENSDARVARAATYIRTNDLYQAGMDLDKIEKKNDDTEVSGQVQKEYDVRYKEETSKKAEADEKLKTNPSDTAALRVQAQTARNLGQFEVANLAATNLLEKDPQNMAALTTLMEIKPMIKDSNATNRRILQAQRLHSPTQIRQMNPRIVKGIQNN